jgi:peptide/nickel transport system ATP-binding protein
MNAPLLQVAQLDCVVRQAGVPPADTDLAVLQQLDFSLQRGRILGLVGESGCGKSMTGNAILGLLEPPARIVRGRILFEGVDLLQQDEAAMRRLRGDRIAMVFQDPMMTLNPVLRIDTQMIEAIQAHHPLPRKQALARAATALAQLGLHDPQQRLCEYPHQLSGGMRQRVAIAIALLNQPALLIADEPTTALDVTTQRQIVQQVQALCREQGSALIWISHDLALVSSLADEICVMYAGRIVERGPVQAVLQQPRHPYTRGLIDAAPAGHVPGQPLPQIPGNVPLPPPLSQAGRGCAFAPRCGYASARCGETEPAPPEQAVSATHRVRCHHPLRHAGDTPAATVVSGAGLSAIVGTA